MNDTQHKLLQCLADGDFHSGEELGAAAGVSRSAVWKQLQSMQDWGILLEAQKSRGYRIVGGLQLLNSKKIEAALSGTAKSLMASLKLYNEVESTNGALMAAITRGENVHGQVCSAERQTAGRGRRGRVWQSPFGCNLYFSIAWRFDQGIAAMEGLSLAVGVALCRTLAKLGYSGIQLKWPNDLLVESRKLGGILLEIAGDVSGDCFVVVGIGLNIAMPASQAESIEQPYTDLSALENPAVVERNTLFAEFLNELLPMLESYQKLRFGAYREEWLALNAHAGKKVVLVSGAREVIGRALGVSETGGLLLDVDGEQREFVGGELSLRAIA